jgi:hypothetical protein
MSVIDNTNIKVGTVKNIGYWRRYYRHTGIRCPMRTTLPHMVIMCPPPRSYGNGQPQEGDYAGAPPPEGY